MQQVRIVPWGSWKEWDCVRAALFSTCDSRISAAIERITAWQARGRVPVSVEITSDILSIQQRDSYFRENIKADILLSEEMLRLMYAMAIIRLINGVVDDKNNFGRGSVAFRALQAELPHLLVGIRHDSAHGELPGISLLRMASKQALEWLEVFYWQQQKTSLDNARKSLKLKVEGCISLLQRTYVSSENFNNYENKHYNRVKHDRRVAIDKLIKASIPATQDLVSILIDDMLLENTTTGEAEQEDEKLSSVEDLAWKYLLSKLSSAMPQLLQMLALGVVRRLVGLEALADAAGHTFLHEGGDSSSRVVSPCSEVAGSKLVDWLQWLLVYPKERTGAVVFSSLRKAEQTSLEIQLDSTTNRLRGKVSEELNRELLSLSLKAGNLDRTTQEKLVKVVAAELGSTDKATKLARLRRLTKEATPDVEARGAAAEASSLESNISEMTRTQQQMVLSGSVPGTKLESQDRSTSAKRKRWTLAEKNWQPCAIGMLPSSCYFGGARPSWLLDCVPELCSSGSYSGSGSAERDRNHRKRSRTSSSCGEENQVTAVIAATAGAVGDGNKVVNVSVQDGHKELASPSSPPHVCVTQDHDSTTPKAPGSSVDAPLANTVAGNSVEIDYHEKTVSSMTGCLLLNGRLQPVGPELFTALQTDIRVL